MKVFMNHLCVFVLWALIAFFLYIFVQAFLRGGMDAREEGFTLPPVEQDENGNEKILSGGERTALFEDLIRRANTNQDILKSMAPDLELLEFQVQKPSSSSAADPADTRSFLAINLILFIETCLKPTEQAMNQRVPQYTGNSDVQELSQYLQGLGVDGIVSSESRDRLETQVLRFVKTIVDSHRRSLQNVQKDIQKEIENNQLAVAA